MRIIEISWDTIDNSGYRCLYIYAVINMGITYKDYKVAISYGY